MTQSPSPDIPPISNARCPRCGYDQRGPVATWKEQCPLQGTCSECGLVFNWSEVLMPEKFEPVWCVEFVPRKRSIPFASVKTFLRSFNPWKFWVRMKMAFPLRKWRLVVYCLMLLLPFLVVFAGGQAALAIQMRKSMQVYVSSWQQQASWQLFSLQRTLQHWQAIQQIRSMNSEQRAEFWVTFFPMAMSEADRQSYASSFEQMVDTYDRDHVDGQIRLVQDQIASLQSPGPAGPAISLTYAEAILEAVFLPLAQSSYGVIQYPGGQSQSYPAPSSLLSNFLMNASATMPGLASVQRRATKWFVSVASTILLTLLLPLTFVLLPVSRRRAKVRWAHVSRIAVYSCFALTILLSAKISLGVVYGLTDSDAVEWVMNQACLVFWFAFPVWWAVAIKRYLKMPHAAAIAGLMTLILALLMSPLLAYVFPQWIVRMILN